MISSGVVDYLAKSGIPIHFFNYYGFYEGSFYPRETLISGDLTVKQASNYLDSTKRLVLAKSFVEGACGNILRNLNYYAREMKNLETHIIDIESEIARMAGTATIPEVMNGLRDVIDESQDNVICYKTRDRKYLAIDEIGTKKAEITTII